jgi:hypothetical protein
MTLVFGGIFLRFRESPLMDRVPKLQHRKILRGCETHRNAEQLIASAYRLITRQSDCGQGDDKGV